MQAEPEFDFRSIIFELNRRGIRYLVFGRQAMRALGSPVLTQDYDLWFDRERRVEVTSWFANGLDYELLHASVENPPIVKVIAGTERIDAWFVRGMVNRDGERLDFDELYARSLIVGDLADLWFRVPSIDDMIALTRMGAQVRPKDEEDIAYLLVRKQLVADGRLKRS